MDGGVADEVRPAAELADRLPDVAAPPLVEALPLVDAGRPVAGAPPLEVLGAVVLPVGR